MKVNVQVPATIANLGCGFDCFGLALPLYNEVSLEETIMPGFLTLLQTIFRRIKIILFTGQLNFYITMSVRLRQN